jgi:hypothetical protein
MRTDLRTVVLLSLVTIVGRLSAYDWPFYGESRGAHSSVKCNKAGGSFWRCHVAGALHRTETRGAARMREAGACPPAPASTSSRPTAG